MLVMALMMFTACQFDDFSDSGSPNVRTFQPEVRPGGEATLLGSVETDGQNVTVGFFVFDESGDRSVYRVDNVSESQSFSIDLEGLSPEASIVCAFVEAIGEEEQMVGEDIPFEPLP